MRTDGGALAVLLRLPAAEQGPKSLSHLGQVGEGPVEISLLAANEIANVWARSAAGTPDGDDLLDLTERESETLRVADEGQNVHRFGTVDTVARVRALWRRQDSCLLVKP